MAQLGAVNFGLYRPQVGPFWAKMAHPGVGHDRPKWSLLAARGAYEPHPGVGKNS